MKAPGPEREIANRTGLEPLMTVAELAELAGQSTRTILRRIADGTIPAARLGGRAIRVSRQVARGYLSGGTVEMVLVATDRDMDKEDVTMRGYRVRMREVVEYDVMLAAGSPEDAMKLAELESKELDGLSPIEDGTPERTVVKVAVGVEPYPDLDE